MPKQLKNIKAVATQKKDNKLMLTKSPITNKQLLVILQRTPKKHIFERPAKGGGTWNFVTGTYFRKVLNYVFGWLWSFEIKLQEEKCGQVVTVGRLTIHKPDGSALFWKEDVGRADIKYKRGTQKTLDYGNDCKASATDCLKRCAVQLGIASDVYGKDEFKDIEIQQPTQQPKPKVKATNSDIDTIIKMSEKLKVKVKFNPETLTKVQANKIIASLMEKQQKNGK